jgi:hypothetical protein
MKIRKQHDAGKSLISNNLFGLEISIKLIISPKEHVFARKVTLVASLFCAFKTIFKSLRSEQ